MRSTEDEDSPKGYRSLKPATPSGAGRKALFAGNGGQLGVFRQTESPCFPPTGGKQGIHFFSNRFQAEHSALRRLTNELNALPGVKRVRIFER